MNVLPAGFRALKVVGTTGLGLSLALAVGVWFGRDALPPLALLAVVPVAWIVWRDVRDYVIPDPALLALAVLAVADQANRPLFEVDPVLATCLFALDGIVCGGMVFLVREVFFRRRGHDGIGFGDVKLAAVGGLLCGLSGFATSLLIASLAGIAVALLARRLKCAIWSEKLPFGALLAPVLLVVWITGT